MLKIFDEQLLDDFANTFYGYGDYRGAYWFIGMEEGGGNSFEEINKRLLTWNQGGRKELEAVHILHQDIGMSEYFFRDPPKDQPTWSRLIRVLLSASSSEEWRAKTEQEQRKAVQNYQVSRLGRMPGQDCLIELFPLPSKSTGHWIYADYTSKQHFKDRKNYRKHYLSIRVSHIQKRIHQYNPAVVVFYGLSYRRHWEKIIGATFSYDPTHDMYLFKKNATLFVTISCQHIGFGIGEPIVDPFLIQPLFLKHLSIFEGMRVKRACFQHNGLDGQQGPHKADFPQMCFDFAPHSGRKSALLDRVFSVQPVGFSISRLSPASILSKDSSCFHSGGNIIAHLHL